MKSTLSLWSCFAIAAATWCSIESSGQNEVDALRYSFTGVMQSARTMGMGGLFSGGGADLSNFGTNPAGIGFFKRDEISLGIGVGNAATEADYRDEKRTDSSPVMRLQHLALLATKQNSNERGWKGVSYGMCYSKTAEFNQDIAISGKVGPTSLLNVFAAQAAGTAPGNITDQFPFGAGLAYQCYVIDPTDSQGSYYVPVVPGFGRQTKTIDRQGYVSETAFGFGANNGDRIYVGLTVSLASIQYSEKSVHREAEFTTPGPLKNFSYTEDLTTDGLGLNFKAGMIARVSEWLRGGVAFHSKTSYALTDQYETSMSSEFNNGQQWQWSSGMSQFQYTLKTPSRWLVGLVFVMGKQGVITADYQYTDYSSARLDGSGTNAGRYRFEAENRAIADIYRSTHSASTGVEFRLHNYFRLRAGAAFFQSPFINGVNNNSPIWKLSAGAGYRKDKFFVDLGLESVHNTVSYYLYDPAQIEPATLRQNLIRALVSAGFRF